MLQVDYRAIVSQADLIYHSPVEQSVEGQPIGNGRMGTLVWTTANAIHCQINRNDVFALNREHLGRQFGAVDYCGGCAAITLDLGSDVFAGEVFEQRLSLYEAEVSLTGNGVRVRCLISALTDVLLLQVDDRRQKPQPVRLSVSIGQNKSLTPNHFAGTSDPSIILLAEVAQRDSSSGHARSQIGVRLFQRTNSSKYSYLG